MTKYIFNLDVLLSILAKFRPIFTNRIFKLKTSLIDHNRHQNRCQRFPRTKDIGNRVSIVFHWSTIFRHASATQINNTFTTNPNNKLRILINSFSKVAIKSIVNIFVSFIGLTSDCVIWRVGLLLIRFVFQIRANQHWRH